MEDVRVDIDDNLEDRMYRALREGRGHEVIDLCRDAEYGALHYCLIIQKSTVLHLACYFKNWVLANKLFDSLSESENLLNKLFERKNNLGDTVLHDACASNDGAELVKRMLQSKPELLQVRNNAGETCVFRAIRYGKMKIFKLLASKVDGLIHPPNDCRGLEHFFQRKDGHTILHTAILRRNFDLALKIAKRYPDIRNFKDEHNKTALQLLACSPEAFEIGSQSGWGKNLLYKLVSVDEEGDKEEGKVDLIDEQKLQKEVGCFVPIIKEVRKIKKGHKDARELSKLLVKTDTSWKVDVIGDPNSSAGEPKEESSTSIVSSSNENRDKKTADREKDYEALSPVVAAMKECTETLNEALKKFPKSDYEREILDIDEAPLLMAARRGCIQIVEDTLTRHPQAVYYMNSHQENLLHVAIKSRNMDIFEYVLKKDQMFARGLLRALDEDKNSILHMVGCPRKEHLDTKMKSPVLQLSEDLNLLKRLEDKCPSYLKYHRNKDSKTAGELFAVRNEKLRTEAKKWMSKTAEQSMVVIILIATITFTAAYTIPGGPDEKTGYPKLLSKPLFIVFTVTDVLSLGFALTAMVVFLTIITSSYQFNDFRKNLPRRLFCIFTFMFLSMTIMIVAFAATIILTVNEKSQWTKIALYVVSFFPVTLFMIYYISIYIKLAEDGVKELVMEFGKFLPRLKKKYSLPCTTRPASSHSSSKSV